MNDRYRTSDYRPEPVRREEALAKALGRRRRVLRLEGPPDPRTTDAGDTGVTGDTGDPGDTGEHYEACHWIVEELDDAETAAEHLRTLRRRLEGRLAERARLLLETPASTLPEAIVALSHAGFAIERTVPLASPSKGDSTLLVSRWSPFRVRPCEPHDVEAILELFVPLFHASRTEEHWRWKYADNPWGRRWISLAVADSGELASHYAGYPVPFVHRTGGDHTLGVQIGDVMTAPAYRQVGLGLASLLGRTFRHHEAYFGRGTAGFYYGFITGNHRKYNLHFIQARWGGTVGYWTRDAARPPVKRGRVRALRSLDADTARRLDAFFERVSGHYGSLIRRDARWLRWRYLECPDDPPFRLYVLRRFGRFGRIVGWGVFRRRGDELRWVDALFDPAHAHRAGELVGAALDGAHDGAHDGGMKQNPPASVSRDVTRITAWFAPRPEWWLRELDRLGFERRPEPDDLGLIYRPVEHAESDEIFADLYYTWGDSDLA